MNLRVRIKDIAEKAGVSPGTVDRVLHNRGNVSALAREKVLAVLEELPYEPNLMASILANNRQIRVAALLPALQGDPYWEKPVQGLEQAAQSLRPFGLQLDLQFFNQYDPVDFFQKGQALIVQPPDGLLLAPLFQREAEQLLNALAPAGLPVALVNTDLEHSQVLTYVGQNSWQSGLLAGKLLHLASLQPGPILVLHLDKAAQNAKHLLEKEAGLRHYFAPWPEYPVWGEAFEDFDHPTRLRQWLDQRLAPGPPVAGILVSNSRAYRLVEALAMAPTQHYPIVGFDLLPANLQALQNDQIKFLINQNPAQQGHQALLSLGDHVIFKKPVHRVQHLPLDVVVAENAADYLQRETALRFSR